jgi:hypothetical protein
MEDNGLEVIVNVVPLNPISDKIRLQRKLANLRDTITALRGTNGRKVTVRLADI